MASSPAQNRGSSPVGSRECVAFGWRGHCGERERKERKETARGSVAVTSTRYLSIAGVRILLVTRIYFTRLQTSVDIAENSPSGGISHFNRHNHPASIYSRRANPST